MTPILELKIDDLPASVRDIKEAIAELAGAMKEYTDKKMDYELVIAANDEDFTGYHERKELEKAEAKLQAIIARRKSPNWKDEYPD